MTVYDLTGALIGLAGACSNNGNTPEADRVLREALAFQASHPDAGSAEINEWLWKIHAVKFSISPGCASCASPCGNTSDLSMDAVASPADSVSQCKKDIIDTLARLALVEGDAMPIESAYQALLYVQSVEETDLLQKELAELEKQFPAE